MATGWGSRGGVMARGGIEGKYQALWEKLAQVGFQGDNYNNKRGGSAAEEDQAHRNFFQANLSGMNERDLINIQNEMLVALEVERAKLTNPGERDILDEKAVNVFRYLAKLMEVAPKEPGAAKKAESKMDPAIKEAAEEEQKLREKNEADRAERRAEKQRLAEAPKEKTVNEQPPAPVPVETKTFLQTIKQIVESGVQSIQAKAADAKANMEAKRKERAERATQRKITKAAKSFGRANLLQILTASKNKAVDKIHALGERASARIMALRTSQKEMEISGPTDFKHVGGQSQNNAATMQANATLDTGHANFESEVRRAEVKPEQIEEVQFGSGYEGVPPPPADPTIAAPPEPNELDDLLAGVEAGTKAGQETVDPPEDLPYPKAPVEEEDLEIVDLPPPTSDAETDHATVLMNLDAIVGTAKAIVEELGESVDDVVEEFEEKSRELVTREDVQNLDFNFDFGFDPDAAGPKEDVAKALDEQEQAQQSSGEVKMQEDIDREMLDAIDAADAIDEILKPKEESSAKDSQAKADKPDSGPSSPRSGPG